MLKREDLHEYQSRMVSELCGRTSGLLWLGLGDGKTVIALTSILDLNATALVVGTKRIIEDTWPGEIKTWGHLQHLTYAAATGSKANREAAVESKPQILGINYESLKWYYDNYDEERDVLFLDESSKMKSHSTKRFKIHMKNVKRFKRRYGMSATPAAESYTGLWAQAASVCALPLIGRTITAFRNKYTTQLYRGMFTEYAITDHNKRQIEKDLAPLILMIDDDERPKIDDPLFIDVAIPWGSTEARGQYREMEKKLIVELEGTPIAAASKGVAFNKCRQIASGFIYDNDKLSHCIDGGKIDVIEEEYDALGGEPVLIFYQYRWERDELLARLEGSETLETGSIERWNEGKISALVLHPASCGHGLNLQAGRHVFWGSLPWSLEHYLQANGRVHRQGQKRQVVIKRFLRQESIDLDVLDRLRGKIEGQDELITRMRERQNGY